MSLTVKLFKLIADNIIPFGDRLFSHDDQKVESGRHTEARNNTARRMKKAVKEGKLDPSFMHTAERMQAKSGEQRKVRSARHYDKKQYAIDQVSKVATLASQVASGTGLLIPPAAGTLKAVAAVSDVTVVATQAATAGNIAKHVKKAKKTDTLVRAAGVALPILSIPIMVAATPIIAPLMTATVLGTAAAAVITTALAVDGVTYFLQKDIETKTT